MAASRSSSPVAGAANDGVRFPLGVFLLSLLAAPVCYGLSRTAAMDDSRLVFLAGVVACTGLAPLTYLAVVRGVPAGRDAYFYAFTVFAFTSLVDFILAGSIDGRTDWMDFYCREGEVYLTTAHGLWINVWDGTFHYVCYLALTALLLRPSHSYSCPRFRFIGLLWSGSILNSMIVLFAGSAIGLHAPHVKPSASLNIAYALIPAIFLWRVLQARPEAAVVTAANKPTAVERKPLWAWTIDAPLLGFLLASATICVFRALVVLRSQLPISEYYSAHVETHLLDSAAYPLVQMLTYAYFLVPYLVLAMVNVWRGMPSTGADGSFLDWSVVASGALLQGTFSYMLAAVREGAGYPSKERIPQATTSEALTAFYLVNGILLVTPLLMVARDYCAPNRPAASKVASKKA